MKALVVYESLFGNTAAVGQAIATSLREHRLVVDAYPVNQVPTTATTDVDLLVVGGPTHAHGMSRTGTRRAGATDKKNTYAEPTVDPGLREWLSDLPDGSGRLAAAFDTRFDKPMILTGSAAKGIGKRLGDRGYRLATEPESFFVTTENQLENGETKHAERWASDLAERTLKTASSATPE